MTGVVLRTTYWLIGSLALSVAIARAQGTGNRAISGRVVDDAGQAIAYASVSAQSGAQTTTRLDGTFYLLFVPTTTNEVLLVRQIGFHAESLTVVIDAAAMAMREIVIKLSRNPIQLSTVAVSASRNCSDSDVGAADTRAQLLPVFDALQENVLRALSLLRAHPLRAEMAITFYDSSETGRGPDKKHRGKRVAEGVWRQYEPGGVIEQSVRGTLIVPVSLGFFVDSIFRSRHCFRYGGSETVDGKQVLRIDFAPNALVTSADWSGSVLIDAKSYVVRAILSSLTYPPTVLGEQQFWNWSVWYDEIFPGLIDMASDRRVRWMEGRQHGSDHGKISIIETRTIKRTYVKDAPGQVSGEPTRR